MNSMAIIILIGLICIIGVVIGGIIYLEKYKEDVKFVCDTMDPDNILTQDECRQIIEQTKGAWGSAVNNAVGAKTTDEYLLNKCIELALITSVSKAECYAYMEKNPGSTGNQVLDGILEQRENYLNKPIN